MKKLLALLLVSLLTFSTFVISASAYTEPTTLLGVDLNLEVGRYSGSVFTPLTPGEALVTNDIITVRIAPSTDFLVGVSKFVVMFSKSYLQVEGANKAAFTINTANPFYAACSDYQGTTGIAGAGIPQAGWPASMVADGSFAANTAISVNNNAGGTAPNGGYPLHMTGEWLFRFNLKVKQNITVGSGAKVWMDSRWVKTPAYPAGNMYFTKCLDSTKLSSLGLSNYYFVANVADANINLEPAANVNITFNANGGTGGTSGSMAIGDPLTAPTVTKLGYTLTGWSPTLPSVVPGVDTTYTAQWAATPLGVTVTKTPTGFDVNVQGGTATNQYQIWTYELITSDVLLSTASKTANQWILSQGYAAGSTGDLQLDGSFTFQIADFDSPGSNYIIAVRMLDADGNFLGDVRDAYTPAAVQEVVITKLLVDGQYTNEGESDNGEFRNSLQIKPISVASQTLIKVMCNNVSGITYTAAVTGGGQTINLTVSNINEFVWNTSALTPGNYTVNITATNGLTTDTTAVSFRMYKPSDTTAYGSISGLTLNHSGGLLSFAPSYSDGTFSYRVREPGKPAIIRSAEFSAPEDITPFAINAYGVYHVYGYVSRAGVMGTEGYLQSGGSYDDGIIKTLVISRPGNPPFVNMTLVADVGVDPVAKGTPITFTADAPGLPGTQYAFWRYDATGYVLVQDWSSDNTLSWTPARVGEYTIEARAMGTGAGSYEDTKSMAVNVTDITDEIAQGVTITLNSAYLSANAQARQPILISANATGLNGDNLLYKFYVYDSDMRVISLQNYSPSQTCLWVPREAREYTISVLVKNDESFGMFDAIDSFPVTVS